MPRWTTTAVLAVALVGLGSFFYVYEVRQGPARSDQGTWDTDTVEARVEFESGHGTTTVAEGRNGTVTRPGANPDTLFPVPLTLRRGTDAAFTALCDGLDVR